jgi:hypothetical protein
MNCVELRDGEKGALTKSLAGIIRKNPQIAVKVKFIVVDDTFFN